MRRMLGRAATVLTWLAIVVFGCALVAAVVVPRIGGATPYAVQTGSMSPQLPPGTLVVVRPVPAEDIGIGDVVTYQLESGRPTVVTHRVVGIGNRLDGGRVFTTRGDANDVADPAPVRDVQVRGRLWYSVPYLGYVNQALTGSQRQMAVWLVAGLLGGYAVVMFLGAVRDRTRRGGPDDSDGSEPPADLDVAEPEELPAPPAQVVLAPTGVARGSAARSATLAMIGLFLLIRPVTGRSAGRTAHPHPTRGATS